MAEETKGELAYLSPLVEGLLATLWKNLDTLGVDSSGRMADLLAYFEDNKTGTLYNAALRRLLLTDRYRDLVVRRLTTNRDGQAMSRAAAILAKNLPFAKAIDSVAILKSGAANTHFGAAYMSMAEHHASELAVDYEQRLADGVIPAHRKQEIVALGNYAGKDGLESAKSALDFDPSYEVKGVALLALGTHLDSAHFEPLFNAALTDPGFGSVLPLAGLVNSIINHAHSGGEVNVIDRASTALLAKPHLPRRERELLKSMREQYIPK